MTIRDYLGDWLNMQYPPQPSRLINTNGAFIVNVPSFIKMDTKFIWDLGLYMVVHKGDRVIRDEYIGKTDTETQYNIGTACTIIYGSNKYMLDGLFKTTEFEYNPIQNYDMVESGSDKHSGNDITRTQYDEINRTDSIGSISRTDNLGTRTTTGSMTHGSVTDTTTNKVSPDESGNFLNKEQDTINRGSQTDSSSSTTQGTIDTSTTQSHTDTYKTDARTDTDTLTHGHIINHELTRSGNIGVMTTQDMIKQEREVRLFNIYAVITNLIVKQICYLVD